jgi:hypothetical protein
MLTGWVAEKSRHYSPGDPLVHFVDIKDIDQYEERKSPNLANQ